MSFASGEKLGRYEIRGLLGKGGMGEVYRAHDWETGRDVAVKVAGHEFSERFAREARIVASLNHTNICTLYDVGPNFLVMELVEGPTLADVLKKGPIETEEAMRIARQIADALDHAHEKHVVHRDLKPANIKIRSDGTVKVLDFGLAKPARTAGSDDPLDDYGDDSPTISPSMTQAGTIVGTSAYMAPEQARGEEVDKRADIWAFGVVLHEMLTGDRLFKGSTTSEVLAAVLRDSVNLENVPPHLRSVLEQCLTRDRRQRLRDIGDLWRAGQPGAAEGARQANPRRALLAWGATAVIALAAVGLGILYRNSQQGTPTVTRLSIAPPQNGILDPLFGLAVSPDGRHIVFRGRVGGQSALWVRDLDSTQPRMLPGTEGGVMPFWSPDSLWVGFFTETLLKKVGVTGGSAITLCEARGTPKGATWNQNDVIVFGSSVRHELLQVSAAGGIPLPLTELDTSRGEVDHIAPWFLPDGRHFLYAEIASDFEKSALLVGDLESKARKQLRRPAVAAEYYEGHLLYGQEGTLLAQPFDASKLEITGDPVPLAENVDAGSASSGVLAYTVSAGATQQLTWFDRTGKALSTLGPPEEWRFVSISPDGSRVVADLRNQSNKAGVWLFDRAGATTRITFTGDNIAPLWMAGGALVTFLGERDGTARLYRKAVSGVEQEAVLVDRRLIPYSASRDGHWLFTMTPCGSPETSCDIWVVPLAGERKPYPLLETKFREWAPAISPDGRWLAYSSNESGRREIYVTSFPESVGRWQVSTNSGYLPVWSYDGRELYFTNDDNTRIMAAEIRPGATFHNGPPKELFPIRMPPSFSRFDVSKDGRFLIPTITDESASVQITVVLNWTQLLKR